MTTSELEKDSIRSYLFALENKVKSHYELLLGGLEFQRGIVERMWVLAQRFMIVTSGTPAKRTFPVEVLYLVEDEIRSEFHIKLYRLDDCNTRLTNSLSDMKDAFYALGDFLSTTDISTLDQTDPIQPSVCYYVELFADFVKFFTHSQSKFNCYAIMLRVDQPPSVERYKALLQPNDEFNDHFLKSLSYCSCLHSQKKEKT